MARRLGRRKFLLYGSATFGTSLLLKACGTSTTTTRESPAASGSPAASTVAAAGGGGDTIKVGILHSLSGTMAISEKNVLKASFTPGPPQTSRLSHPLIGFCKIRAKIFS